MTQFRIDVVVDPRRGERGIKRVGRGLTELEKKANKTQLALQKAFKFVTIGFAVKQIVQLADAFTNLQNRLRVVTSSQQELTRVTEQLLQVANRSRSSFEATADLYSRMALATRELNLEGADLIKITESINKAIILSGASAKEANNGLIQLSQGLASGRLTGDELRSTLEQLPIVADVIAKRLGVTRGELRALGAQGKITSIEIIKAFQDAEKELDAAFAETIPTLGQSFVVLRNNVEAFIGRINEGTGVLRGFGAAIRFVGTEIETIVKTLTLVGATAAAIKIAPLVQSFFALQAAVKAGNAVILGSVAAAKEKAAFDVLQAQGAVAVANAEALKTAAIISGIEATTASAVVEAQATAQSVRRAETTLAAAAANRVLTATSIQLVEAELARLRTSTLTFQSFAAEQAAETQLIKLRATLAGFTHELAAAEIALAAGTKAATIAESAQAAVEKQLIALKAGLTVETEVLAAAELELAGATAVANTQANIFTRTLAKMKAAVVSLGRTIAKNPVGLLFVALAAAASALFIFRNEIKLTEDGVGTLGDLFNEFFAQLSDAFGHLKDLFLNAFSPLVDAVKDALDIVDFEFADLLRVPALFIDRTIGFFLGLAGAIGAAIASVPAVIGNIFVKAINFVIATLENIPQAFIGVLKTVGQVLAIFFSAVGRSFGELQVAFDLAKAADFSGAAEFLQKSKDTIGGAFDEATTGLGKRLSDNIKEEVEKEVIPRIPELETTFKDIGLRILNALTDGASFSGVRDSLGGLLEGAEDRGQKRENSQAEKEKSENDRQAAIAAAKRAESIQKVLGPLAEENRLLGIAIEHGAREADVQKQLTKAREALAKSGAKVTFIQAKIIEGLIRENAKRKEALSTAQGLQTAEQKLVERLRELKNALDQGTISMTVFNEASREAELVALESSKSFADGWEAAIERATDKLRDFGQTAREIVGIAIPGLVNSLGETFQAGFGFLAKSLTESEVSWVNYREAIKETFAGLIDDILAALGKLLAQKALIALLESFGDNTGVIGSVLGAIGEKAHGGLVTANKPYIVGEEGPEIVTPGQTGSVTPTDQTISALTSGAANQRETIVMQAPAPEVNVQTVIVDDPSKIPAGIQSPDGRQAVRNVIREESSGVKRDLA